ncbi:hypothetical protein Godav_004467 [Gossypium davidsonii]|uniref:Uncharacterized protein n=2 Tax=Gossypium TaxID=3633 RepID=A0A7J8SLD6_GOSDV|nr:hypothetical protein [Gossypium davidsonii]MBA0662503.1 hypothetical protein [Gossypium klotzschianum]
MMESLKKHVDELKGELILCKVAIGNGELVVTPKHKNDASKSKKFKRTKSIRDANNFLCINEKCGSISIGTWVELQKEFKQQCYLKYAKNEARAKL